MKRVLMTPAAIAAFLLALALTATSAASPKDWRDLIPANSQVESHLAGDLNRDGRDDVVAVVSRAASGGGENRSLWIFFKKKDGGYKTHTRTARWPGFPSLLPVGLVGTESANGDRIFKWKLDAGRDRFYLIEEAVVETADLNYQTLKLTRRDAGRELVICRLDRKKATVPLKTFDAEKLPPDPTVIDSCA
ncbi:MAG TPA: hypothetical protein VFX30_13090, partial [bacterium]|nr:hypothetical protein [bacterium]